MTMQTISRRAAIAAALARAKGSAVSGQALASELGVSRVAVGKHVAALRALGYEIEGTPHAGYRLVLAPDACIPEEVAPRLTHPLWVSCEGAAVMPSTNDAAKSLAQAGAPQGTLVVAGGQTGGRGRFGRAWSSPAGGMYASFVLRPALPPAAVAPLSLAVALGVARALEALGVPARLKWPNDVHADGRKLGGILLEMAAEAERVEWIVAGIGVNVDDPSQEGSSWAREFVDVRCPDIAAAVLDGVAAAYEEYVTSGFGGLRGEYVERLTLLGSGVCVSDALGSSVVEGVAAGVSEDGALLVDTPTGRVAVNAGEVTLRR